MPWEHELLRGELKAVRHMRQLLFIPSLCVSDLGNCEEGWTKFQGHCYRHFEERETWMDAESRCRQHQAHLSSIITPEEQEFVNSECWGQPETGHGSNHWALTLQADLSKVVWKPPFAPVVLLWILTKPHPCMGASMLRAGGVGRELDKHGKREYWLGGSWMTQSLQGQGLLRCQRNASSNV